MEFFCIHSDSFRPCVKISFILLLSLLVPLSPLNFAPKASVSFTSCESHYSYSEYLVARLYVLLKSFGEYWFFPPLFCFSRWPACGVQFRLTFFQCCRLQSLCYAVGSASGHTGFVWAWVMTCVVAQFSRPLLCSCGYNKCMCQWGRSQDLCQFIHRIRGQLSEILAILPNSKSWLLIPFSRMMRFPLSFSLLCTCKWMFLP